VGEQILERRPKRLGVRKKPRGGKGTGKKEGKICVFSVLASFSEVLGFLL